MMTRFARAANSLLLCLALASGVGCAATMRDADRLLEPDAERALVTFLRPAGYNDPTDFSLWNDERFIGVLEPRRLIQYRATPGQHLFVGHAHNWAFVSATLEAGKHYYVLGKVYPGEWGAQVALYPVNDEFPVEEEQLSAWLRTTVRSEVVPEQRQPYQAAHQDRVRAKVLQFEEGKIDAVVLGAADGH